MAGAVLGRNVSAKRYSLLPEKLQIRCRPEDATEGSSFRGFSLGGGGGLEKKEVCFLWAGVIVCAVCGDG